MTAREAPAAPDGRATGPLAVCHDLVAGRIPPATTGSEAAALPGLLRVHGLSGLAAVRYDHGELTVPPDVAAAIHRDWAEERRWSAALDLETERIGRLAGGAGPRRVSPPILLKGPAVASRYGNPAVRTYGDIDLLVPADELPAWGRILTEVGYERPHPWVHRDQHRFAHAVDYRRPVGNRRITCDLHQRLFVERRARTFGYGALIADTEPSRFDGLLQATAGAQLVVLALHLIHHQRPARRLLWLRDFIEIGTPEVVEDARRLAARHGVGWVLERALAEAEQVLGNRVWGASAPVAAGFGLARVQELDRPGHLYTLALVRELGFREGARYLLSRFDPRRFMAGGRLDRASLRDWVARNRARFRSTPWLRGWRKRR